jgi:hypothetical protein
MLTRGNAFSFLQRKFMSQEDLECSLPTHMAKAIALRMLRTPTGTVDCCFEHEC